MGVLVDRVGASLYVLVGLVKLYTIDRKHGLSKKGFTFTVSILILLSIVTMNTKVPTALPPSLFLISQTMTICKTYDKEDEKGVGLWITTMCVTGMILYELAKYGDLKYTNNLEPDMIMDVINEETKTNEET